MQAESGLSRRWSYFDTHTDGATSANTGPCQTPTLYFCVQRQREIAAFVPRAYFSLVARVVAVVGGKGQGQELQLEWAAGRVWEEARAQQALARCLKGRGRGRGSSGWEARVVSVKTETCEMVAPVGLNTVALLTSAANSLGFSPAHTMVVAERLYMAGSISYPRTESTRFPQETANLLDSLQEHAGHTLWGAHAQALAASCLAGELILPPKRGTDVGDHPPIMPTRSLSRAQVADEGGSVRSMWIVKNM